MNTPGRAAGSSTCRNVRRREASKVRISLIRSGSTAASPAVVVTTIEKNETSAITTSFGSSPKPSQKDEHGGEDHDGHRL